MRFDIAFRKPLPPGICYAGSEREVAYVDFLVDKTFVDDAGNRRSEQQIFDALLEMIAAARQFVLLDMFLYNPFGGRTGAAERALSSELTEALVARKLASAELNIVLITDPINTVYGGLESPQFQRLREVGVRVVETRLDALRDSNPIYSLFWRLCVRPFGNEFGRTLPNPFGKGRVSVRSYLHLLNFKANHRKVAVADYGDNLVGMVTSANPHDASSSHTNVAIRFAGLAAVDLLESENAVLAFCGAPRLEGRSVVRSTRSAANGVTVQIVTERKIKSTVVAAIAKTTEGDRIDLAMFYLADRQIINELRAARLRHVTIRVLLDPNIDAFGHLKHGIPAQPVAHELHTKGVPIRWSDTHGEQCHMKMMLIDYADGNSILVAGSANYTRRNLENFNLETNVAVRGPRHADVLDTARDFFELVWSNAPDRNFSAEYATRADASRVKTVLYRFMEGTGISTF